MQGTFFTLQFFGVIRASTDCISVRQLLLLGRRNDNAESDAAIIFWRHTVGCLFPDNRRSKWH